MRGIGSWELSSHRFSGGERYRLVTGREATRVLVTIRLKWPSLDLRDQKEWEKVLKVIEVELGSRVRKVISL